MGQVLAILFMFCFASSSAMACTVGPWRFNRSLAAVKSDFDQADSVVIATVLGIEDASRRTGSDAEYKTERATFRVERAFKGTLRAGDTFHIDSRKSLCGSGVANSYRPPLPPSTLREERALASRYEYPKQWLIYLPSSHLRDASFQVGDDPHTQPLTEAANDLRALHQYSVRWRRGD